MIKYGKVKNFEVLNQSNTNWQHCDVFCKILSQICSVEKISYTFIFLVIDEEIYSFHEGVVYKYICNYHI